VQDLFEISETEKGFILKNERSKYIMFRSGGLNRNIPYYLKRVIPDNQYITGLFYKKKYDLYVGKDMTGNKVSVKIVAKTATIRIS